MFTKVANPDVDPSIAGAQSVHTLVNVNQESSSFSKNSENMFITSIAFVVVVKGYKIEIILQLCYRECIVHILITVRCEKYL